ncbi:hypothetical protein E4U16_003871 [Claviceps sp. LM84 group G4]|nr:hypothetical protein E4U16_003871 [Claviceps sp. LM84 group G4]
MPHGWTRRTRGWANDYEALSSTKSKSKLLVKRLHDFLPRAQGALNPASVIGAVDPQVLEKPAIWSTPISDLGVETPLFSLEYPSLYPSYRPLVQTTVPESPSLSKYSTDSLIDLDSLHHRCSALLKMSSEVQSVHLGILMINRGASRQSA